MLKKVLLVRHAQSEEDVNPNLRDRIADRRISITEEGRKQIAELVAALAPHVALYRRIRVYTSPSSRAGQTTSLFTASFPHTRFDVRQEERIRNLNWGGVTEKTIHEVEKERYRVGVLYFQFPNGDNTPEFVREIEAFVSEILSHGVSRTCPKCIIIFTHGFALRVIAKAFLEISDEEFRYLRNPPNCYVASLTIKDGTASIDEPLPRVSFDT